MITVYKDDFPEHTLERVKNIISDLNLSLEEKNFKNIISNIYSARITISGTDIGTNGKGTSLIFSMASAYCEFIERLANLILLKPSLQDYQLLINDLKTIPISYVKNFCFLDENDDLTLFNSVLNKNKKFFQAIPLKNMFDGSIIYLPLAFLRFFGSNGMASGNTYFEMAVQAISEIFERYCMKQIIAYNAEINIIPNFEIERRFSRLGDYIKQIREEGLNICFYDCSLGKGIPCFAVMISNKERYSVSFGVHPNPEYAITRCITELWQGCVVPYLKNKFDNKAILPVYNLRQIFKNGIGDYGSNILCCHTNNYHSNILDYSFSSSRQMYNFYLQLLKNLGFSLFYRDNSYLGFPAGQFFVPKVSDIFKPDKLQLSFIELRRKYIPHFEDVLSLSYDNQLALVNMFDFMINTKQSENGICYVSKLSLSSQTTLYLYMYLLCQLLGLSKKSNKYALFLKNKANPEIHKILASHSLNDLKHIFLSLHFARIHTNYFDKREVFTKLGMAQKEYLKCKFTI